MKKGRWLRSAVLGGLLGLGIYSCHASDGKDSMVDVDKELQYCDTQIKRTLYEVKQNEYQLPRRIEKEEAAWYLTDVYDWTSGFWPGILWYNYENTREETIKEHAVCYTEWLEALLNPEHKGDHDLGFQLFCSFGNAYRLTGEERFKKTLLAGADKLAGFYNPKVGTILSWEHMVEVMGWPHNTIMDNMMNLEILFWAARNGGKKEYYDMAVSHARKTMENQFRPDATNYHVAVYDTVTGAFLKGVTNQGYADESFWARGQAWGIYGYTMVYRETQDKEFLRFAEKITEVYLERLPEDLVPFWDFDDPAIPDAPRDASSAAIVASALLELSQLEDNPEKAVRYKEYAIRMLGSLSSEKYQSGDSKPSFLVHSTGNYPGGYEIDASINYADHYYIEALIRYKKIEQGIRLSENLYPDRENKNSYTGMLSF
ncbi:MAG: glycoside hydrolase family 88 protein [Candidatus Azobacteroides sp.]|nr:glycoside hydrolase family 88 protein [Candidatus Azobacteroides sp.]